MSYDLQSPCNSTRYAVSTTQVLTNKNAPLLSTFLLFFNWPLSCLVSSDFSRVKTSHSKGSLGTDKVPKVWRHQGECHLGKYEAEGTKEYCCDPYESQS